MRDVVEGALLAIGLMSGTSRDGVDAALLETDGVSVLGLGPALSVPYSEDVREELRTVTEMAKTLPERDRHRQDIARAERRVTEAHADAVARLLAAAGLTATDIDVIGFHGQTIHHRPAAGWTWQIGDAERLARETGVDVVADFRSNDMAHGGQGAPLAPFYHAALCRSVLASLNPPEAWPVAVLNVGGVANVTFVPSLSVLETELVAFDTGPGNALIDDLLRRRAGLAMDENGELAAAGRVDEAALAALLSHAFFEAPPPKSLDRDAFSADAVARLSLEDAAATLTAFTAQAVARGFDLLPERPRAVYVCGGGRKNPVLMRALRERSSCPAAPVESLGWRGDSLEAEAFAYLAVRSLRRFPLSAPGTTRVAKPVTGGAHFRATRSRRSEAAR